MKIIVLIIVVFFASCAGVMTKKDAFIGEWVMSESSPMYSIYKNNVGVWILKITKEDIFYKISFDGMKEAQNKEIEYMFKYQLSPDKHFLFNINDPSIIIMFNEDNNTITTFWGWFIRK